uniref:Secreted protein n=1 Tax=Ascaris lumbricoides TaxID=6252 RepID=A0A0M3I7H7_ASCLU
MNASSFKILFFTFFSWEFLSNSLSLGCSGASLVILLEQFPKVVSVTSSILKGEMSINCSYACSMQSCLPILVYQCNSVSTLFCTRILF